MPLLYSLVNLVKGYFYCGVVYLIIIVNKFKVILDDWNFKGHTIYQGVIYDMVGIGKIILNFEVILLTFPSNSDIFI